MTVHSENLRRIYDIDGIEIWSGDAFEYIADILPVEGFDAVVTDPPYGMKAVQSSGVLKERYGKDSAVVGDEDASTAIRAVGLLLSTGIKAHIYWGANYYSGALPASGKWLVWDKVNGSSDQMDAELAWTNFDGVTRMHRCPSPRGGGRFHPTQKPLSLMEFCLLQVAHHLERPVNEIKVFDPFMGSATTLLAAKVLGARGVGVEIRSEYCEQSKKRFAQMALF